jgi:hypothetical protein
LSFVQFGNKKVIVGPLPAHKRLENETSVLKAEALLTSRRLSHPRGRIRNAGFRLLSEPGVFWIDDKPNGFVHFALETVLVGSHELNRLPRGQITSLESLIALVRHIVELRYPNFIFPEWGSQPENPSQIGIRSGGKPLGDSSLLGVDTLQVSSLVCLEQQQLVDTGASASHLSF